VQAFASISMFSIEASQNRCGEKFWIMEVILFQVGSAVLGGLFCSFKTETATSVDYEVLAGDKVGFVGKEKGGH